MLKRYVRPNAITRAHAQTSSSERLLVMVHGLFYILTGLWPIIHLRSFERITGPKTEGWLVKTVGALISVIGMVQLRAGLMRAVTTDVRLLSVGSALVLAASDVIFVARRRISPVYLLDALAELALAAGWGIALRRYAQIRTTTTSICCVDL